MSLQEKIRYFEFTHTGQVRDHNEDAVFGDMELGLVVLADGMGGYNAGEVAAELWRNHPAGEGEVRQVGNSFGNIGGGEHPRQPSASNANPLK